MRNTLTETAINKLNGTKIYNEKERKNKMRNEKKKKISHKLITFSLSRSLPVSVCIKKYFLSAKN